MHVVALDGKTTYLAQIAKDCAKIEAWDIHEHRTKLVEQAANRLNIKNIKTKVNDATIYKEEYKEVFDKILLDVPCLGIGVLRRKPDIKWQRKKEDIEEIRSLQKNILNICCKYLKPGGKMVYSTCSIFKSENEDILEEFLNENKNFSQEKIILPKENYFYQFLSEKGALKIYQNSENDGFFIAQIVKK